MSYTPDQLHAAIESGLAPRDPEIAGLARLAGRLAYLSPSGPSSSASARMALRFEAVMAGQHHRGFLALLGFASAGHRPSLVQRLAAGAAVAGLLGGATSAATGVSPAEAALGTAHFVASAIANLAPNNEAAYIPEQGFAGLEIGAPSADSPEVTPDNGTPGSETPAPGAAGTVPPSGDGNGTPQATATPTGTVTPTPPSGTATKPPVPKSTPSAGPSPDGFPIPGFNFPTPPTSPAEGTVPGPVAPSPSPSQSPSASPTPSSTPTPTATPSPSPSPTPTSTPTPSPTPSPTATSGHHDDDHETPEPTETPEPRETPEPEDHH